MSDNESYNPAGTGIGDPPDVTDIVIVAKPPSVDEDLDHDAAISQAIYDASQGQAVSTYRIQSTVLLNAPLSRPYEENSFLIDQLTAVGGAPAPVSAGPFLATFLFVLADGSFVFWKSGVGMSAPLAGGEAYTFNYALENGITPVQTGTQQAAHTSQTVVPAT